MAFGTSKTREANTLLTVPNELSADAPVLPLLATLRDMLARQGVCESLSSDQEGFYFVVEGRGEISLQYQDVERDGSPPPSASLRRHAAGLLKCCAELAPDGHTLTLVLSPRTLALHIRFE